MNQLQLMNSIASHTIAKDGEKVVGYTLAVTKASIDLVSILSPMFVPFDPLHCRGKKVSDFDYLVIGQICVGKSHRGQGLFDRMYAAYREAFSETYSVATIEIAKSKSRSLSVSKE